MRRPALALLALTGAAAALRCAPSNHLAPRVSQRRSGWPRAAGPGEDELTEKFAALFEDEAKRGPSQDSPSHLHIERDRDGEPEQARFVYVDEHSCIGCTHCATTARSTFCMEELHGRARVYNQAGDQEPLVQEAIETCPVDCIHYVSVEDLVRLERARDGGQLIENKRRLVIGQEFAPTEFEASMSLGGTGAMRCNNCPSRGCENCPMFGVGQNPVYLRRAKKREDRRRRSGVAAAEEEDKRRAGIIGDIFSGDGAGIDESGVQQGGGGADVFGTIFADSAPGLEQPTDAGAKPRGVGSIFSRGAGSKGIAKRGPRDAKREAEETSLGPTSSAINPFSEAIDGADGSAAGGGSAGGSSGGGGGGGRNVVINAVSQAYYDILGVRRGSNRAEVKKAYYRLAKEFHPDTVNGDPKRNPTAAGMFSKLTEAYEIICEEGLGCEVDSVTDDISDLLASVKRKDKSGSAGSLPGFGRTKK